MNQAESQVIVPLGSEAHYWAERIYQKQPDFSRKRQIYLNVLAVHAVSQYFQWFGISSDWQTCDSHDPVLGMFMDVADLEIIGRGKLECRPVLPGEDHVFISSDAEEDRIGYVAVQFDEALETATLLGFTKTVSQDKVPLDTLESIETLLDIVGTSLVAPSPVEDISEAFLNWHEPVPLRAWLSNQFNELVAIGWQAFEAIERFITPESRTGMAFQVRSHRGAKIEAPIKLGKLFNFEKDGDQVALVMGLQEVEPLETEILVEVYPTGGHVSLPKDLQLLILDETGTAVMQTQACGSKNIQMEFSGEPGEQFSIKLAMGEFSMTEAFQL
ncbi:MAG: DUF1822 family protein [Leptolyngbya sp. SIO3F4]|nr:DUF1822 family protein [Leptolyngbya sp. SIO3F4]